MKCAACAQALTGQAAEFRANCSGCAARAVAQSEGMAALMKARQNVREVIRRTMPGMTHDEAFLEVMAWWRIEEQAGAARQTADEVPR